MTPHVLVVGSGPGATFCAKALIDRGMAVTLFDAGETLPAPAQALVDSLAGRPPAEWEPATIARLQHNDTVGGRDLPRKRVFGSDYVYGTGRAHSPTVIEGTIIAPTYARGGYTTVWGGAVLPVHDDDIRDWPFRRCDLDADYRAVLTELPLSAAAEAGADAAFPLHAPPGQAPLTLPAQAEILLRALDRARPGLDRRGLRFGRARLAVRTGGGGCVDCGLCLSGCPVGAIYTTAATVARWHRAGRLAYQPGRIVRRVAEEGDRVRVTVADAATGAVSDARFDAVFLGAGAINSTRIILDSLGLYGQPVRLKDSQKFFLPILSLPAAAGALEFDRAPALPAVFLETRVPGTGLWAHLQVSPMNAMVLRRLGIAADQAGGWAALKRGLATPLLKRMMIIWGGLHSDLSSGFIATLDAPGADGLPRLRLTAAINPETAGHVGRLGRSLFRTGLAARTLFLPPLIRVPPPGEGNHYGASLPMRADPQGRFETDRLGRPGGFSRVFVVDGAVLPSIPATTLAFTIMANAHRIGRTAPLA